MLDEILAIFNVKTILIGLLTGYVVHWLMQRYKYKLPPGPFPLPLIGNILKFKTGMIHEEAYEMSKTYGPVLSIYVGPMLVIFINDIESAMEVLVKRGTDFANKFRTTSINVFSEGGRDIAFADYGPTWRVHRKIAAKALRHYMQGQALEDRIHDALATVHDEMKKEVKPFDPGHYMDFIVGNILIGLCFGGKYKYKDPELIKVLGVYEDTLHAFSKSVIPEDIFPPLQYFWESSKMKKLKHAFDEIMNKFLRKKYYEHVETFDKGNIRDFTDTLILARKEAEEDTDEPDVQTLTDTHIIQILLNLFFGKVIILMLMEKTSPELKASRMQKV